MLFVTDFIADKQSGPAIWKLFSKLWSIWLIKLIELVFLPSIFMSFSHSTSATVENSGVAWLSLHSWDDLLNNSTSGRRVGIDNKIGP